MWPGSSAPVRGYTKQMQLRNARLCLDCEELHDAQQCPACGSESFSFVTRWIPAPERRLRPRPEASTENTEAYRQLLVPDRDGPATMRWLKRGVLGLATVGIASWVLRTAGRAQGPQTEDERVAGRQRRRG